MEASVEVVRADNIEEESGGLHIFELHLPAAVHIGGAVFFFIAGLLVLVLGCCCYTKLRRGSSGICGNCWKQGAQDVGRGQGQERTSEVKLEEIP